jgi:DNA-binding transcriptional regulator YiaG
MTRRNPRLTERDLLLIAQTREDLESGRAREQRVASGWSVAEIAGRLEVTPQAVRLWERGKRKPVSVHALGYGRLLAAVSKARAAA